MQKCPHIYANPNKHTWMDEMDGWVDGQVDRRKEGRKCTEGQRGSRIINYKPAD